MKNNFQKKNNTMTECDIYTLQQEQNMKSVCTLYIPPRIYTLYTSRYLIRTMCNQNHYN